MIATQSRPWSEREFLFFGSMILVCTLCLLAGVVLSGAIEASQFIFARGLFEWDDIIHNS